MTANLRGTHTPTRWGNGDLGYAHFSGPHNLTSHKPIRAAFQTRNPDVNQGAHLEYITYAVNTSDASIKKVVRVVVQAARQTDDGRWRTLDGSYIGVITAFCQGSTLCPNWVNTI